MLLSTNIRRWLRWTVIIGIVVIAGLHLVNAMQLDTTSLKKNSQALIDRAENVRERAIPEYQELVLATLPPNPNNGPFYRFDDNIADATSSESDSAVQQEEGGEFVLNLEFDDDEESVLIAADGGSRIRKDGGFLHVKQAGEDYLINEEALSIPLASISDIIFRTRASEGSRFELMWASEGNESRLRSNRLSLDLIADDEFHTYIVNAQNAFQRGVGFDENISQLAIMPSNADGADIEIDFIRIVSKQWKYQAQKIGASYETVNHDLRRSIHMIPGQRLEYTVEIPEGKPELSFGTASLLNDPQIGLSVDIGSGTETTRIHDSTNFSADEWREQNFDLDEWAGQTVRVAFETTGTGSNVAFISNPTVRSERKRRFNVIMILEDTLRADYLSLQGHHQETSPARTRFMDERGIVFLNAHSQATKTRPSVPSLMTSLYPSATGVWNFADSLSERYLTLAEILRSQGFMTASFIQNDNAGPYAGNHQGFGSLRNNESFGDTTADIFGDEILSWIDDNSDQNFFLYLHAIDPHGPYDPPEPFDQWYHELPEGMRHSKKPLQASRTRDPEWAGNASAEARRLLYEGEIRNNDEFLGQFLEQLEQRGLLEDTVLLFVSDHGEWMGERGLWQHLPPGNRPTIHVPFQLSYPRLFKKPMHIEESVQNVDAMPTILELAEVDASDLLMHGDSLVSLINGSNPDFWQQRVTVSEEPMLMKREDPCACGSLFFGPWQLHSSLQNWPKRLPSTYAKTGIYRFREDGVTPVASYLPDLYVRYLHQKSLSELISANVSTWRKLTEGQEKDIYKMDPDTLEKLRGLGYVN